MKIKLLLIALVLFLPIFAYAHQPRIISGSEITEIKNPEISQAFYGELKAQPAFYKINSQEPFNLYVQILVPDIQNIKKNISVEIQDLTLLSGENYNWTEFYEPFAGDNYFQGPDFEKQVKAGEYQIKVFSPDNFGKYVLVVGRLEKFPLKEIWNTIVRLPKLKRFFEKSIFTAYFNYVGLMLLGIFIIIGIIACIAFKGRVIKNLIKKLILI